MSKRVKNSLAGGGGSRYVAPRKMEVNMTTDVTTTVEYLDALRKAAGRAIDPETAEVACWSAYTLDPYDDGREIPEEGKCFGLEWFARDPQSKVWVLFGDLPDRTRKALSELPAKTDELPFLSDTPEAA